MREDDDSPTSLRDDGSAEARDWGRRLRNRRGERMECVCGGGGGRGGGVRCEMIESNTSTQLSGLVKCRLQKFYNVIWLYTCKIIEYLVYNVLYSVLVQYLHNEVVFSQHTLIHLSQNIFIWKGLCTKN